MKTPRVLCSLKGSGQLLHTSHICAGPPCALYMAEFLQGGHSQEVSSMNGGLMMTQESKEQERGQWAESWGWSTGRLDTPPDPLNLENGKEAFIQSALSIHTESRCHPQSSFVGPSPRLSRMRLWSL